MRAISLWEPWASAMAAGHKRIETRSWPTPYRGDVLICAALKIINTEALGLPNKIRFMKLHHGSALCVVELYDCVRTEECTPDVIAGDEEQLGDYSPGRFAWLTKNRRQLKLPTRWRGKQGMWSLTPDEESQIRALL